LIKKTADALAHTINTQGLPQWIMDRFGEDRLSPGAVVRWDVTPPKDLNAEASAFQMTAQAMTQLTGALATHGIRLDAKALAIQFGVPFAEADDDAPDALLFDVSLSAALDLASAQGLRPTEESVRDIVQLGGIALEEAPRDAAQPRKIDLAPTDVAKVIRASEARASQGLPPFGDDRDDKTIVELGEEARSEAEAAGQVEVAEAEKEIEEEGADMQNGREVA
jgi:hypothetical protein